MPYLSSIIIYPVKSLDPLTLLQARIVDAGGIEHDRELAIFDENGKFVNGKRNPRVHLLSAAVDWKEGIICLQRRDTCESHMWHILNDSTKLNAWLSDYFAMPVVLRQNTTGGFPDDSKAPGPTLIGASTLEEIASWYDHQITLPELSIRFRANLQISDAPAFWEDRLYGNAEEVVRFQIGDVLFEGMNPCQRCIVPTRDSSTGDPFRNFSEIFRAQREATLPAWANASRFNHFYRLALNTCVPASEVGKMLRVGDEVVVL